MVVSALERARATSGARRRGERCGSPRSGVRSARRRGAGARAHFHVRERARAADNAAKRADERGVLTRAQLPCNSEMWHCPSCGAPQAETARCWVCRRSSTTCSTCTHFRPALAGDLGYCGRDAKRQPLTGRELRGCWEPRSTGPEVSVLSNVLDEAARARRARAPVPAYRPGAEPATREFIPVESVTSGRSMSVSTDDVTDPVGVDSADAEAPAPFLIEIDPAWDERMTLFGDPEG